MKKIFSLLYRHKKIIKYLISGGSAAVTNLAVLYVSTDFFGIWYIASSGIAFIVSFFVSFILQKFWTFGDTSLHIWKEQIGMYLMAALGNLALNTVSMFCLVEYAHLHYLLAQIITSAFIAFGSFFIYQNLIFSTSTARSIAEKPIL